MDKDKLIHLSSLLGLVIGIVIILGVIRMFTDWNDRRGGR